MKENTEVYIDLPGALAKLLMENTVASRVQIFAGAQTIIAVGEGLHDLFFFAKLDYILLIN